MEFTADMTVAAVRVSGVPIYHDGLYFAIPNGSFRIIEACSGIRMLMAGVAVGALFAYLNFYSWARRVLFLCGVVVLTIIANWVRAYIVVMLAHFSGMDLVADHIWLGYVVFAIVIVIMLWCGSRFTDMDPAVENQRRPGTGRSNVSAHLGRTLVAACVIVGVVVSAPVLASTLIRHAEQTTNQPVASLPKSTDGWSGPGPSPEDWRPMFRGDTMMLSGRYLGPVSTVDVYIISYRSLSRQSELINETNRIFDPQRWILIGETSGITESAADELLAYHESEIREFNGDGRLIRHWYVVDGRPYRNRMAVKLIELRNTLAGQPTLAGVIAISAPFDDDAAQAARGLDAFMAEAIR